MENKSTIQKQFSAFLFHLLNVEKVCTQAEIGDAVEYTQASISAISLGKMKGSEDKRRAIARYFGKTYEEFLQIGQSIIDGTFNSIQSPPQPPTPPQLRKTDIETQANKDHQELVGGFIHNVH